MYKYFEENNLFFYKPVWIPHRSLHRISST